MTYRILIIVLALTVIAGAFLLIPRSNSSFGWVITATHPLVIGGYGDNFSYSGTNVRPLIGRLSFKFDPASHVGTIAISITTTEKSGPIKLSPNDPLSGAITLVSHIDTDAPIISGKDIYGDTGIRAPKLPETYADLAGESLFDLYLDGKLIDENLHGEWMVAQALRKPDGAIRKSGLYYSPLLRDKTGFADPKRREFTLIVHSTKPDPNNDPPCTAALQLVFTSVTIEKMPQN